MHGDRIRAESFGEVAERYDRSRPRYPEELIDHLTRARPSVVLDVGCGTGIASRQLLERDGRVLGVEPDERMAAIARAAGIEVEVARFEHWDAGGRRFDLLVSAQAWHWVEPRTGARRAAELLVPGGTVGLFWNFIEHSDDVATQLERVYARRAPELARSPMLGGVGEDRVASAARALRGERRFGTVERRHFRWQAAYSTDAWLDLLPTHSDHLQLPPARLAALLDDVGQAIDERGGELTVGYTTVLVGARRREADDGGHGGEPR